MTNFCIIFALFLLLQLNLANFLVFGNENPMPVAFSTKYGGLTGTIGFGQKISDMSENWFENVMLSTTNTRTFLVNGGTPNECFDWHTFCKLHPVRYDPVKAGTTTRISYFVDKLTQNGVIVQDNILLPQYPDRPLMHKIGLMNEKVDNDPGFWGPETNLASGCLSLMSGMPKEIQNFGEKTPLQEFVDQFPLESFISIRLEKFDESNPKYYTAQSSVPGSFSIGRMPTIDQKCMENGNEWNNVKSKAPNVPWTFQIDGVEVDGTHWPQKRMALIDSGSENILLPKNAWTILKDKFARSDGKCNWQLPTFKFHINSFVYFVPPQHYLQKESESSKNCALLLGPNMERENEFRLGLPFLRSVCVGLDLRTQEVWLSENKAAPIVNGSNFQNLSMAIKIIAIGAIVLQIFTIKFF